MSRSYIHLIEFHISMKFYESHYEDYIQSVKQYNLHPELDAWIHANPSKHHLLDNRILYGPPGSGKYTQCLRIMYPFSPSGLKYDKKINLQTDKYSFIYRISDIHYEIDLSLLGCNPKTIWHEVFMQIVDIISVKTNKMGFILCKNFHMIHTELLDIFYSYIQQYSHSFSNIQIRFILLTEHISFIPNNILRCCRIFPVKRPSIDNYIQTAFLPVSNATPSSTPNTNKLFLSKSPFSAIVRSTAVTEGDITSNLPHNNTNYLTRISNLKRIPYPKEKFKHIMDAIPSESIQNMKEIKSFSLLNTKEDIPSDIFDIICNNIIHEIEYSDQIVFTHFRDVLYDILIYNLDVAECFWTIFIHFIKKGVLEKKDISDIVHKTFFFLKYFNNNYRPIYHLESIFFYIIIKLKKYNECSISM